MSSKNRKFTESDRNFLIERFNMERYPTKTAMKLMASKLGVDVKRIKYWYESRRRTKRKQHDGCSCCVRKNVASSTASADRSYLPDPSPNLPDPSPILPDQYPNLSGPSVDLPEPLSSKPSTSAVTYVPFPRPYLPFPRIPSIPRPPGETFTFPAATTEEFSRLIYIFSANESNSVEIMNEIQEMELAAMRLQPLEMQPIGTSTDKEMNMYDEELWRNKPTGLFDDIEEIKKIE